MTYDLIKSSDFLRILFAFRRCLREPFIVRHQPENLVREMDWTTPKEFGIFRFCCPVGRDRETRRRCSFKSFLSNWTALFSAPKSRILTCRRNGQSSSQIKRVLCQSSRQHL